MEAIIYPTWTNPPAHLDNANEEYRGDNSQIVAPATAFAPDLAPSLAGILFVIMLAGGVGSIFGCMLIGLLFGFAQAAPLFMPPYLIDLLMYVFLFLVLLVKPEGLFTR